MNKNNGQPTLRAVAAIAGLCLLALLPLHGASAATREDAALDRHLALEVETSPVTLDGEVLFRVRGTSLVPSAKRAGAIAERLKWLADNESIPVDALHIESDAELSRILAGEQLIMVLADIDAEGVPRDRLAELVMADINAGRWPTSGACGGRRVETDELARRGVPDERHRPLLPLQDRADGRGRSDRRARTSRSWSWGSTSTTSVTTGRVSGRPRTGRGVPAGRTPSWARPRSGPCSPRLGLRTWDKPAAACLASRLPYGTEVTVGSSAESTAPRPRCDGSGSGSSGCRHYGDTARLELDLDELPAALDPGVSWSRPPPGGRLPVRDPRSRGFRSGNLNAVATVADQSRSARTNGRPPGVPPAGRRSDSSPSTGSARRCCRAPGSWCCCRSSPGTRSTR